MLLLRGIHDHLVLSGSNEAQDLCHVLLSPICPLLSLLSCNPGAYFLNHTTSPCMLSSPAWPSFLPGGRCPSSATPGTACLPEDCPCRPNPPRARQWSPASSAPLSGPSCCCSLWAASGWTHLCSKDRNY